MNEREVKVEREEKCGCVSVTHRHTDTPGVLGESRETCDNPRCAVVVLAKHFLQLHAKVAANFIAPLQLTLEISNRFLLLCQAVVAVVVGWR